MRILVVIVIPTAILAFVLARFLPNRSGAVLAAVLPVCGFAGLLLYDTYVTSYNESDFSEWVVALVIGGIISAYAGYFFHWLGSRYFAGR
jgi:hypothetical protein